MRYVPYCFNVKLILNSSRTDTGGNYKMFKCNKHFRVSLIYKTLTNEDVKDAGSYYQIM